MPRWQDTEASLVEGFIWFEINALAICRRYLVQSIYHTTLYEFMSYQFVEQYFCLNIIFIIIVIICFILLGV